MVATLVRIWRFVVAPPPLFRGAAECAPLIRPTLCLAPAFGLGLALSLGAIAQDRFITLASTTSTEQSGLFGHVLPIFQKKTGVQVRVVALGTGQALDLARRGR